MTEQDKNDGGPIWRVPSNADRQPGLLFQKGAEWKGPKGLEPPIIPPRQYDADWNPEPAKTEVERVVENFEVYLWHKLFSEGELARLYRSVGLNAFQVERILEERREFRTTLSEIYRDCDEIVIAHRRFIQPTTFIAFDGENIEQSGAHSSTQYSLIDLLSVAPSSTELVDFIVDLNAKNGFHPSESNEFQRLADISRKKILTQSREETPLRYPQGEFWPRLR